MTTAAEALGFGRTELDMLLEDVERFLRRYIATLSSEHFAVLTLWAAHTWVVRAAHTTPYLHLRSAEPESGKTRVLEVLQYVTNRPSMMADPSPASLYRGLDSGELVTLLIDEVDNYLPRRGGNGDAESKRAVLGLLNAGYREGITVPRVLDPRSKKLEHLAVFGPKALTGLDELPHALATRCLRFTMKRRRRDEPLEKLRHRKAQAVAEPLRERFTAWATDDAIETLADIEPDVPDELSDRMQDACELLVAIADMAAGHWPDRARAALVAVTHEAEEAEALESRGTQLLADISAAFAALGEKIATSALLDRLNGLDERPWGGWHDGKGFQARDVARLLRPYGVRPKTLKLADGTTAKGYPQGAFDDVFARYLALSSVTSVTSAPLSQDPGLFDPSPEASGYGWEEAANPHGYAEVTEVTAETPQHRADGVAGTSPADPLGTRERVRELAAQGLDALSIATAVGRSEQWVAVELAKAGAS